MTEPIHEKSRMRTALMLAGIACVTVAILHRAYHLQIESGDEYRKLAEDQITGRFVLPAKRAEIYDRNGVPLAVSTDVPAVAIDPQKIRWNDRITRYFLDTLNLSREQVTRLMSSKRKFEWVAKNVTPAVAKELEGMNIEGLQIVPIPKRFYPNGRLLSNVLGFAGESDGLSGLEYKFNRQLKGQAAVVRAVFDARRASVFGIDPDMAQQSKGSVLNLTIDAAIQSEMEEVLRDTAEEFGARGGFAIMMDPRSGDILAMASVPDFDPNHYDKYDAEVFRNRAVHMLFEPGSTLKVFIVARALDKGVIRSTDIIDCENGSLKVGDRVIHDTHPHAVLTVPEIVKYSSNIGTAKIGMRLGSREVFGLLEDLGLTDRLRVGLPNEAKTLFHNLKDWNNVVLSNVSFGQGIAVTGLHMVAALSSIANQGEYIRPRLIKNVGDATKSEQGSSKRIFSTETAKSITDMMIMVTGNSGTGKRAAIQGFEVAGKTGTAQKPSLDGRGYEKGKYVASFLGFVPARSPRISLIVAIDEPAKKIYGGDVAAPAFSRIASAALRHLGVRPDLPLASAMEEAVVNSDGRNLEDLRRKTVRLSEETISAASPELLNRAPDFMDMSLRRAAAEATERGVIIHTTGSGRVVSQIPSPGAPMGANEPVYLNLAHEFQ